MSTELHADDDVSDAGTAGEVTGGTWSGRARPNLSGDLSTVLQGGPMFRHAVAGYDRFQVDTYVRWAEDELVAADRQHEHLLARHLETQAALAEARALLSHSPGGADLIQASRRIGSMLAAAADEAESIRAEAEDHRAAACAQAEAVTADAARVLADAEAAAERLLAGAAADVAAMTAEADRLVAEAQRAERDAHARAAQRLQEAAHRLEEVRAFEQRSMERAEQLRVQALEEAASARLDARAEVVRMLDTARQQRRRADAEAATAREAQDRDAVRRRAAVLAELAELETRRDRLRTELEAVPEPPATSYDLPHAHARPYLARLHDRLHDRLGRHLSARGAAPFARDGERTAA